MKKLLLIAIALITFNANAQKQDKREGHKKGDHEMTQEFKDFSPEEIATLQTKKMALQLDLTEAQQREIKAIHLEQAKNRQAQMEMHKKMRNEGKDKKLSAEERFNKMNSHLDHQLATKAKFKSILTKEQYERFERSQARKGMKRERMQTKRGKQQKGQKRKRKN